MKPKIIFILSLTISIIFLIEVVSAITDINPTVVYPQDTITLTIKPTKAGFYNIIYVMQNNVTIDFINIPCSTICKQRQVVTYTVPLTFLGEYYFATFDYNINDYELDYLNVIEQGGSPSGTLTIQEIKNSGSAINFLINPEQSTRANITITTLLNVKNCQNYNVTAYLCNETLYSSCSFLNYTYKIPLNFKDRQRTNCFFNYIGKDYFPFYEQGGLWKIIAKSGITKDEKDFSFSFLKAVNYSSAIDFGTLNSNMWNIAVPQSGLNLTNAGNSKIMVDWTSSGFQCISANCTDFWETYYQGENTFQIDDDPNFLETNETGFLPEFITNYSLNFFPQENISVCISDYCNNSVGEKLKTYYNLKIPSIQRGAYQGDIIVTLT